MSCFQIESSGSTSLLRLTGEATIADAAALQAALKAALAPAQTLRVDATGVERIDAAMLQLLLAAKSYVAAFELTATSPAWNAAAERYGLPFPPSAPQP